MQMYQKWYINRNFGRRFNSHNNLFNNKIMIEKLGGRKFVFAVLITVAVFVLALLGKITYEQFTTATLWALGIFSAANASQKFAPSDKEQSQGNR